MRKPSSMFVRLRLYPAAGERDGYDRCSGVAQVGGNDINFAVIALLPGESRRAAGDLDTDDESRRCSEPVQRQRKRMRFGALMIHPGHAGRVMPAMWLAEGVC